jgi:hypothetical protein
MNEPSPLPETLFPGTGLYKTFVEPGECILLDELQQLSRGILRVGLQEGVVKKKENWMLSPITPANFFSFLNFFTEVLRHAPSVTTYNVNFSFGDAGGEKSSLKNERIKLEQLKSLLQRKKEDLKSANSAKMKKVVFFAFFFFFVFLAP